MIEVLAVIFILAVITGPLAAAFYVTAHNSNAVNNRLTKSHDAQLVANYIVTDAQSTKGSNVSFSDLSTCGPSGSGLSSVARFFWTATSSSGSTTQKNVNYVLSGNTVTRWSCDGSALPWSNVLHNDVGHSVASAAASCTPSTCAAATGVAISVTETQDPSEGSPFTYSLAGTFRQVPASGSNPTPPPAGSFPLLTLGSSGTALSTSPSGSITVKSGSIVLDSTATCPVNLKGTTTPSNVTIDGAGPPGGNCVAGYTQTGGSADPYQGLAPPAKGTTQPSGSCSSSLSPGYYPSGISVSGNTQCTLQPGTYFIDGGLSTGGSAGLAGAGVLLYINSGTFSTHGGGAVTLTPQSSGTYAGIVIFQSRSDSNALSIGGNGSITTISGLIYAPNAAVGMNGNNSATTASSVIAQSVDTQNGGLTVG